MSSATTTLARLLAAQLVAAEDKKIPLHNLRNQRSTQQENYAGLTTALVGISRLPGLHRGPAVSFVVLYRLDTAENITIRVNNPTQYRSETGTAASVPIINRTAASEMGLLAFVKGVFEHITTRQKQVYLPLDGFASSIPPEPLRCATDRMRLVFAFPERRRSKSAPPKPEPAEDADLYEEHPLPDDWPDKPEANEPEPHIPESPEQGVAVPYDHQVSPPSSPIISSQELVPTEQQVAVTPPPAQQRLIKKSFPLVGKTGETALG
ncbi:hypothetical protein LTR17_013571 [Elasticomyces elasticus]|nr:hypothetical protein LTR17_013571 [Elasticomyces elasticus]